MQALNFIALTLMIIGGLNWGLYGVAGIDLVATLFGERTMIANIVYVLVGLSAVYSLMFYKYFNTGHRLKPSTVH